MKLEILIGMIASGKSTYCKKRALEGAIVINDDSIVNALHANEYTKYNKGLKPLYKAIENLSISWGLAHDLDVLIDRPNLNSNTRRRYIELARAADCEVIEAVVFPLITPSIAAARRASGEDRGRDYKYWFNAASYQYSLYQEPKMEEGFTKLIQL